MAFWCCIGPAPGELEPRGSFSRAVMDLEQLVNVADFEALAAERLEAGLLGYYAGGAGDERTLAANVAAFGRRHLRPRVLVDVSGVSAATTVLGHQVSMPVLVAPTALHRMAHADGEPGMARAAAAAGAGFLPSPPAPAPPNGGPPDPPAPPPPVPGLRFRHCA